MTYNQFLLSQALMTSRAEKAKMRRMSRRQSERRVKRAIGRKGERFED